MSTVTLNWTLSTARTDGTPLANSEIASVSVLDDTGSGPQTIATVQGAATSYTTGVLAVGVHNFTVIENDTTGHSSAPSNTASITVAATLANPNPASGLTATLNP